MTPDLATIAFGAISNMTGGLITDCTTLVVAILAIEFVVFGLSILRDNLEAELDARAKSGYENKAAEQLKMMESGTRLQRDLARSRYQYYINKAR